MENKKNKSSILLSIFLRKGGEGILTKIITDENKIDYPNQIVLLRIGEVPLLCFKEDAKNWLMLTNERIIEEQESSQFSLPFSELTEVHLAVQEELKDRVINKHDFTRIALKDRKENKYIIKVEKGNPFRGIYQVLHYVASNGSVQKIT